MDGSRHYLPGTSFPVGLQLNDARGCPDRLRVVLLTHMHGDHVCDLFSLFMFGAKAVHGPRPGIEDPVKVIRPGPSPTSRGGFEPYGPAPFAGVGGLLEHSDADQAATLTAWAVGKADLRDLVDLHEIEDPAASPSPSWTTAR